MIKQKKVAVSLGWIVVHGAPYDADYPRTMLDITDTETDTLIVRLHLTDRELRNILGSHYTNVTNAEVWEED